MISDIADQLRRTLAGRYTLERELEGGGMSRLFVAEELSLGRKVVVKVLPSELAAVVNVERFRREIQVAARLQHPNIVPVLATGVSDGLPYYTMPLIEGESLRARLARSGELPVNETVRILSDVLSALDCAHAHGILHRDIKPENVLLTGHRAVVADFGIAKALSAATNSGATLTSHGVAIGTPAYMAPEQAVADPAIDHRADLYAVGAIGYEMLTGQHVFVGRPAQALLGAHAIEQPEQLSKRRPSVPPGLASLIMRALEKRPADRPQSAGEMLATLEALPTSSRITFSESSTKRRLARLADRQGVMALLAAVVLLLPTSSSWYWYTHKQPRATPISPHASASLAVLPFENLGKPEDSYFADGMAEEISTKLAALSGVRVIGRQSARTYSHSGKPIPQIGKELGVEYILTGSVRWDRSVSGRNVVRISPTLLRASDGTQLWSDPYEDQYIGVFDLQSKVAQRVASALRLQLSAGDQRSLTSRLTDNLEAYDYYLRGKASLEKGGGADALRAIPLLQRATKLDPKFAMAFTTIGLAHTRAFFLSADPTQHRLQLAKKAIDSALTLDQQLPAAHAALGNYYFEGFLDARRAVAEFDRAIQLSPEDAQVLVIKGRAERRIGDWKKAIADLKRAASLEPRSLPIHTTLAVTLLSTRDYEGADSVARLAIGIDSTSWRAYSTLAGIAIQKRGDLKTAVAILLDAASKVDPDQLPNDILSSPPWALSADSRLSAIAHKAPVPAALGSRLDFFLSKLFLARYEKDSATLLAAADSILALVPTMRHGTYLDDDLHGSLAFAYAARGEKQKALAEAKLGVSAYPYERDAVAAFFNRETLASVANWVGDNDLAIATYRELLRGPAFVSRAYLRKVPLLEPLRRDVRFQRLISGN